MKTKQAYIDQLIERVAKEEEITIEHARERVLKESDYVFDINKAQPVEHHWIDRGAKLTCEGAMHPSHSAWKRR